MSFEATWLTCRQSVENVWPDKIQYSISTPSKGVVFGTPVRIDFEMIPLLKGLKLGKIEIKILQNTEVTVESKEFSGNSRTKKEEAEVASAVDDMDEDAETEDIDGQDGYRFSRWVQIPRSLRQCLQSVDEKNILIKHYLKFIVQLLNPDGHVSEV